MLWTIFVILSSYGCLGMVTSYTLGGFIHILLVIADRRSTDSHHSRVLAAVARARSGGRATPQTLRASRLCGSRLDQLERRAIGGHEGLILGNVFGDLCFAIGPVVEAREIPEKRCFVVCLSSAIKCEIGCPPCCVGDHGALERVPLEMQMALRFGIFGGRVIPVSHSWRGSGTDPGP